MTQVMNPSQPAQMTSAQMGKFSDLLTVGLRKLNLPGDAAQQIIEKQTKEVSEELVAVIQKRVEALTGIIVRRVKVDRTRSPEQALKATSRNQYTDKNVFASMPNGDGVEVDMYFFKLGRSISDVGLDKEYELRGFVPADPYSLAAVNEADPAFADDHPNSTHWKDAQGKWCYATFDRWGDERDVGVHRDRNGVCDWSDGWWFAGLRK